MQTANSWAHEACNLFFSVITSRERRCNLKEISITLELLSGENGGEKLQNHHLKYFREYLGVHWQWFQYFWFLNRRFRYFIRENIFFIFDIEKKHFRFKFKWNNGMNLTLLSSQFKDNHFERKGNFTFTFETWSVRYLWKVGNWHNLESRVAKVT